MARQPFVASGRLGWGNSGCNSLSSLDVYGPGDRWAQPGAEGVAPPYGGRNGQGGDLLPDALVRQGGGEGDRLVILAMPRFCGIDADEAEAAVRALLEQMCAQAAADAEVG